MKLVVGLGNPGSEYSKHYHNVGFMMIDVLTANVGTTRFQKKFSSLIAQVDYQNKSWLMMKPQTYMNHSGEAVAACSRFYQIVPEEILVISDDLDLEQNKVRFRLNGGHGGHNGLRSIVSHLQSNEFKRIRIGIGRPPTGMAVNSHVLGNCSVSYLTRLQAVQAEIIAGILDFTQNSNFSNHSLTM